MPILAPLFREINFSRLNDLKVAGLCDATIAGIVNDETDRKYGIKPKELAAYFKITAAASGQMLVSKKTARAVAKTDPCEQSV